MDWKVDGIFVEFDNCFSLNFDYIEMKISIPQLHLTPESNMKLNFDSPISCLIVMIGGKYVYRIGSVMEKVNSITNDLGGIRPIAVFLISNSYTEDIMIDVDYGFERYKSAPVMVLKFIFILIDKQMKYKVQLDKNKLGKESHTVFKVYCPGQYDHPPNKLMMEKNGSLSKNIKYKNVCKEQFPVHVAYNNEGFWFEIENNSMVDTMVKYQKLHGWFAGIYSFIVRDFEILSSFFKHYDIVVEWINCNYTWGVYDDETGKWTGAVGQVNIE